MPTRPSSQTPRPVLWRSVLAGDEVFPAGSRYSHENRVRDPAGQVALQWTLAGSIQTRWESNRPVEAGPGSLTLLLFGTDSSYGFREPLRQAYACRWLNLDGAGLFEHCEWIVREHGMVVNFPPRHRLVQEFADLFRQLAGPSHPLRVVEAGLLHQFILNLIEHLEEARHSESTPVERAVRKALNDPLLPWSTEQYAQWAGCSREHLSRIFRERTGRRLQDHLLRHRTERAKLLLRETRQPAVDVARLSGFASYHAMARNVRLVEGCGPLAYRTLSVPNPMSPPV